MKGKKKGKKGEGEKRKPLKVEKLEAILISYYLSSTTSTCNTHIIQEYVFLGGSV